MLCLQTRIFSSLGSFYQPVLCSHPLHKAYFLYLFDLSVKFCAPPPQAVFFYLKHSAPFKVYANISCACIEIPHKKNAAD